MKHLRILFYFSYFTFHISHFATAQDLPTTPTTQTIRGKVTDKEAKATIPGVSVAVYKDSVLITGTSTDEKGNFRLTEIPIGRRTIKFSFIGYEPLILHNIEVTSGKEVILNMEMEEAAVAMQEVVITANRKDQPLNEMTSVSARTFTVEEANRYAGSRGEVSRMSSNYAGVQGSDDSRNDIVIRGNSPMGLLWRLEGIDIPNPNHFAIAGSTGGPVSILNNKVVANSDFLTAAFPAEYGNSIAGVFDLKFRNGNNEKHEHTGQFGFLGTEITTEGPISKSKGSSYLIAYRYSTLQLFNALNIDIGTTAIPNYQDISFKFNFPMKDGSNLAFFGVGGKSKIDILKSNLTEPQREIYGKQDRDQRFGTSMGTTGLSY